MSENMKLYNQSKEVPANACKSIQAGRLRGMTDINPMWRIKKLTELFGPAGVGWYYEVISKSIEEGADGVKAVFVDINLYYMHDGEWSKPIFGTGGNTFVAKEKSGMHTSDECFKMALTDAISVATKAIGIGADIYWQSDKTKYSNNSNGDNSNSKEEFQSKILSDAQIKRAYTIASNAGISNEDVKKWIIFKFKKTSLKDLSKKEYEELCESLAKKIKEEAS